MTSEQTDILRKGDIRRVRPHLGHDAEARMALIVRDRDDGSGLVEMMLAHERTNMAGPSDVVLQPDTSRLPHGLVVRTFARGCIWRTQCSDLVVRLTPEEMRSVREVVSAGIRRSRDACQQIPELEPSPERKAFLESEHEAYWELIGDCADAVLDDGDPWRIDPGLFLATLHRSHDCPDMLLASLDHVLRTRDAIMTLEDAKILQDIEPLELLDWTRSGHGEDLVSAIISNARRLIASALSDSSHGDRTETEPPPIRQAPQRRPAATPLTLQPGTRLITASHLWSDNGDRLIELAQNGCPGDDEIEGSTRICQQDSFDIEVMMLAYGHSQGAAALP